VSFADRSTSSDDAISTMTARSIPPSKTQPGPTRAQAATPSDCG
jgi:hypothetical protein